MLGTRVLVLNQNYQPLSVCSAQKAIVLLYLGKAEMIEHNHDIVHSVSAAMPLPSIVRLNWLIKRPHRRILLTRKNIIKRDMHTCQYCGRREGALTVDHVIPRTRGGPETWENLVCACLACNGKKGNRTPKEAELSLLSHPRKPGYLFFVQHLVGIPDERWKQYLYLC
ncbi:MAG TPA: HNH endonuclease [bacterium]|nr:HNH endonuclease [bacterium]